MQFKNSSPFSSSPYNAQPQYSCAKDGLAHTHGRTPFAEDTHAPSVREIEDILSQERTKFRALKDRYET